MVRIEDESRFYQRRKFCVLKEVEYISVLVWNKYVCQVNLIDTLSIRIGPGTIVLSEQIFRTREFHIRFSISSKKLKVQNQKQEVSA